VQGQTVHGRAALAVEDLHRALLQAAMRRGEARRRVVISEWAPQGENTARTAAEIADNAGCTNWGERSKGGMRRRNHVWPDPAAIHEVPGHTLTANTSADIGTVVRQRPVAASQICVRGQRGRVGEDVESKQNKMGEIKRTEPGRMGREMEKCKQP